MRKQNLTLKLKYLTLSLGLTFAVEAHAEGPDHCGQFLASGAASRYFVAGDLNSSKPGDRLWATQHIIDDLSVIKEGDQDKVFSSATEARECLSTLLDVAYKDSSEFWLNYAEDHHCMSKDHDVLDETQALASGCKPKVRKRVLKELNYLMQLGGCEAMASTSDATKADRAGVCTAVKAEKNLGALVTAIEKSNAPGTQSAKAAGLPAGKPDHCIAACTGKNSTCTKEDIENMTDRGGVGTAVLSCGAGAISALVSFVKSLFSIFDPDTWGSMAKLVGMAFTHPMDLLDNILAAAGKGYETQKAKLQCYENPAVWKVGCEMATNLAMLVAPGQVVKLVGRILEFAGVPRAIGFAARLGKTSKFADLSAAAKGSKVVVAVDKVVTKTSKILEFLRIKPRIKVKGYKPNPNRSNLWSKLNPFNKKLTEAEELAEAIKKAKPLASKLLANGVGDKGVELTKLDKTLEELNLLEDEVKAGTTKLGRMGKSTLKKAKSTVVDLQESLTTPEAAEFRKASFTLKKLAKDDQIAPALETFIEGDTYNPKGMKTVIKALKKKLKETEKVEADLIAKNASPEEVNKLSELNHGLTQGLESSEKILSLQETKAYKAYAKAYTNLQGFAAGQKVQSAWGVGKFLVRVKATRNLYGSQSLDLDPAGGGEVKSSSDPAQAVQVDCTKFKDNTATLDIFKSYVNFKSSGKPAQDAAQLTGVYQQARATCASELTQDDLNTAERNVYRWNP